MLNVHLLHLLSYMYTWLVPRLYMINEMWNKWNEMVDPLRYHPPVLVSQVGLPVIQYLLYLQFYF